VASGREGASGPLAYLLRMRERYGDVFPLRSIGGQRVLVVGEPETARQVFSAPADVLRAGEGNRRVIGWLLGDDSLILLDGERHMSHRRRLLPPLHGGRLAHQAAAMRARAEEHLDRWPLGKAVATLPLLRALALDVVLDAVFGDGGGEGDGPMLDALRALPSASPSGPGDTDSAPAIRRAEDLVDKQIARRRRRSGPPGNDVLSFLLDVTHENGSPLSAPEVRDELITLVLAGSETTAASLSWALQHLARSPEALALAAAEAPDGGGHYSEAVIRETLRMRPAVPMSARLVERPFRLGERRVPEGTVLAVSALLIHHRPDLYPEPMAFLPDRFLEEQHGAYAWIPFGGGVRRCVGASFAMLEMRIVLSALLSRMVPRPAGAAPETMRARGNILVPERGGRVAFEPR
jgi:cytochrome P450 family 135